MNKEKLLKTLESMDMRPGRGLGQNFLQDNNLLDYIVRSAGISENDKILETGPGFGVLTELMLAKGADVTAIEYDHRLADYLRKNFDGKNFHLIEADACKVDLEELTANFGDYYAVANLPYAISSVFIARLLELPNPPKKMVFMLQKEMGHRLAAVPGIKNYGSLSVRTQLLYDVKILRIVPPEVFYPPPKVDSAIVAFELKKELPSPKLIKHLSKLVKHAFEQRRKQMGKVLGKIYGREKIENAFNQLEMPLEIRPDKLTVEDFVKLTETIFPPQ